MSKQKSLTLPLAGTSSPALLVPDNDCEQQQLVPPKTTMKSQSLNRHHTDYAMTPKSDDASTSEQNRVGQSVFYDCIDASPGGVGGGVEEKQDIMKPEKSDTDEEGEPYGLLFLFWVLQFFDLRFFSILKCRSVFGR